MPTYKIPAVEGKVDVKLGKDVKVTSWHSYGDFVIVETDKEVKKLEKYKI